MGPAPGHLDTESGERQPLLSPSQIEQAAGEATSQSELNATEDPDAFEVKDGLTWRWYAFYGLLLISSVLAVTLLIKGFIDAGDKDVGACVLVLLLHAN
jgi:hypothetical protein